MFDTGSSDLIIPSSFCQSPGCIDRNKYYHNLSSTYKTTGNTFSDTYGKGQLAGNVSQDVINIAGIEAVVTFGEATETLDN